ncbi:MAG: hypothetical protein C0601_08050 [Candidatus Muiribacterium halophilum]|uniref:Uncharacterized protein n=1 Tax=Muiribacterium halophilum TaxID=2053465 RepID=A0A2N5ZF65_MUIH1|nr:MAG: hypothetical protein C0601_08050 [Candidatus Muirbacterium halophilum]
MKKKLFIFIIILCLTIIRSIILFDFAIEYLQNDEGLIDVIQYKYKGFDEFINYNKSNIYSIIIRSMFSENIVVHLNRFILEAENV